MKFGMGSFAVVMMVAGSLPLGGVVRPAAAALITQWDVMSGVQHWGEWQGRGSDRVSRLENSAWRGEYRSWPKIADPFPTSKRSFGQFTSAGFGMWNNPGPTMRMMPFSIDPFSFHLGFLRGYDSRSWNVAPKPPRFFFSERFESRLFWERVLDGGKKGTKHVHLHFHFGPFPHEGKMHGGSPAPIAIPASLLLYGTGLFGVGSWTWLKCRRQKLGAA